jgi:tyrosinase
MRFIGFFVTLFILALSLYGYPFHSVAQVAPSTTAIYTDSLQTGWTDASYNTTNSQVTTPAYQGTNAISSVMNADGGLDFQSTNGFLTNGYTAIRFALRASQTGQQYEVYADSTYGQPLAVPVSLSNYGGQPTITGWTIYTIPLSDLNANNRTIRDFVIHEARSSNEPALFVDQVEIVGTATQTTPTPVMSTTPSPTPTITPTPTLISTPTPTSLPTATTLSIFTDSLQPNWTDASYNSNNSIVTNPVYQGTSAISAVMNADGGLDFQSVNGLSTTNFTSLRFALRASQSNQQYEVYADTTYGSPLRAPVSLSNYGGQPITTGWTIYTIPLADLNATNRTIRDFVIHEARSTNQPVLYVDQVELVGTTPQITPTPSTGVTVTPTNTPTPTQIATPIPSISSGPTPTPTGATTAIYTDALQTGWTDASYSTTNAQVSTPVYQGTRAISAVMNADGGLDFQSVNGLSTNGFISLRFALRASQIGQQYEVYADTSYGSPLASPVSLSNYGGQPTTTSWTVYTIPLADLNATNRTILDFVIHDARSSNEPALYVDQVELVGTVTQSTPTPTSSPTATPTVTLTPTPVPSVTPATIRKSIYSLTPDEVNRLVNAINALRANGTYQIFMQEHMNAMSTLTQPNDTTTQRNVAHRGPAFLPWHREFTREFELALQQVDPSVTVPYWPFEQETPGQLPRVFSAAYFGGDGTPSQGDRVTDGPFASWGIIRRVGRDPNGASTLPTSADLNSAMQFTFYDVSPYNESSQGFRDAIEGWIGRNGANSNHNRVHEYVGGDMLPEGSSGNVVTDPIFWLVHANIDRLWAQWEQTNGTNNYQPVSGGPAGHNLNDVMQFLSRPTRPADTLNIANMGYSYQ